MSFITVDSVVKIYQPDRPSSRTEVLRGIELQFEEGEFVAIEGPSGSGKTTLLGIVGAMHKPTEGRVVIDGIDVYSLGEEKRADFRREYVGFIFQQHHLLPYLTAVENVMVPLAVRRIRSEDKRLKALCALDQVGLGGKVDRLPSQLSGGEQGRVAIARAVVNEPPLILADEPTGNLDSATGQEIIESLCLLSRKGHTVLMVTHNPEAAAAADRIVRIHDGRLVANRVTARRGMSQGAINNDCQ
jgi:putative ABC transport system ATP-binding protein